MWFSCAGGALDHLFILLRILSVHGSLPPVCMCFVTSKSEAMVFSQNRWRDICFWRNSSIPGSGLSEERGGNRRQVIQMCHYFAKVWKKIQTITVLFELCSNNNHINNVHFIKHIVVLIYATTQQLNCDKWIKKNTNPLYLPP